MTENTEERVGKLYRFLTGPGGYPHCCAIMIFDEALKLTFATPMVARIFGVTFLEHRDTFFQDIFTDHVQTSLKKIQQYSILNEDWVDSILTVSHQSRQMSRRYQVSCLNSKDSEGQSFIFSFLIDDHSPTPIQFANLFKRAIKLSPDGMAKLSVRNEDKQELVTNQCFEFFDNGLMNLLNTSRTELLNLNMASLMPPDQVKYSENIWEIALGGYLDGYTYYSEFLDTTGQIICARITPFILNEDEYFREYLLMFTKVPKDPTISCSAFNSDALIAGLSHANVAIACLEDFIVTLANDVFLSWVGDLRRDGKDLISWLNEVSPEYRKTARKHWERGVRRNQPFTLDLTLKSDPDTPLSLTIIPQQKKIGQRVLTQLLMIGVKQNIELTRKFTSLESVNPAAATPIEQTHLAPRLDILTKTERRVAELIKKGQSSKEIARELAISPGTVNIHRKNIRRKLELTGAKVNLTMALSEIS